MPSSQQQSSGIGAGIGAGIGGYLGGGQGAAAGASIGGTLGGAFGGSGASRARKDYRKRLEIAYRNQARFAGYHFGNLIHRAKEAGIHPLVAMGISPHGQTPAVGASHGIPGQSNRGSAVSDAAAQYLAFENQKLQNEYIEEQILASRAARAGQASNAQQELVDLNNSPDVHRKEAGWESEKARTKSAQKDNRSMVAGPASPGNRKVFYGPGPRDFYLIADQDLVEPDSLIGAIHTLAANLNYHARLDQARRNKRKGEASRHPPSKWGKWPRKRLPRSSAPYRGRWPSHHYR